MAFLESLNRASSSLPEKANSHPNDHFQAFGNQILLAVTPPER